MNILQRIVTAVCLLSIIVSCAAERKDDLPGGSPAMDYRTSAQAYMPLDVGNSWSYVVNYLGQAGEMTVTIDTEQAGWYVDNRGQMLKIDRRGIRDRDRYLLRFPLGKKPWITILNPAEKEVRTVVDTNTDVTVPAGTFKGTVVVMTEKTVDAEHRLYSFTYFAAGVGIVKIVTMLEDRDTSKKTAQTVTELKKYRINGQKN